MSEKELIRARAEEAKHLYNSGLITRAEAKLIIQPYIEMYNAKSIEIAKKYNMKPKLISFTGYAR